MRKNKKYSPELKIRICEELLENNIAIKRVAIRENIDQHTSKSLSNEERFKLENLKLKTND